MSDDDHAYWQSAVKGRRTVIGVCVLLALSGCSTPGHDYGEKSESKGSSQLWVTRESLTGGDTPAVDNALEAHRDLTGAQQSSYIVKRGDGLTDIAQRLTGDAGNWRAIAEYNRLANPDALAVGETLRMPPQLMSRRQASDSIQVDSNDATSAATQGVTERIDLLDVIGEAQDYDADFQAAITNRSISHRSEPIARSALLPQISLGYAGGYYNFKSDSSSDYTGQQLTLTLSQAIYDRANAIAVKQAKLTGSVADMQLQAEHEDLVIRVATSYFNVLKAKAELDYRQSDVVTTRQQLAETKNRYEVGTIAITDYAESRAQSDLAAAAEITARADLDAALEALQVMTGSAMSGDVAPLRSLTTLESPDPADAQAWVQTALANNKSLLVARNQIEIAQQQVDQTRAGRMPVVSLTGYLSGVDSDYDASEDISAGGYTGNSVELGITLPLSTGGLVSAQIAQQQDRKRLADDQMLAVERQTIQTTRDTYRGVVASISRVEALSQAQESTRRANSATRSGFEEGTRTSVDVLGSQRDMLRAQTELTAARYDYVLQVLELKRVSGTLELADIQRVNQWLD